METQIDTSLIDGIQKGGIDREIAIRSIYHLEGLKNRIIQFVEQNNGNIQDGQDVFHEGIIVLDRNIREGKYRGESCISYYLFGICRFLWMNQIRKKKRVDLVETPTEREIPFMDQPEQLLLSQERREILREIIGQLNERCQAVLECWQLSYSMEEIAEKLNFSSEKMARKAKYRCQQKLIKLIKNHPLWKEMTGW